MEYYQEQGIFADDVDYHSRLTIAQSRLILVELDSGGKVSRGHHQLGRSGPESFFPSPP